jgi:hypothetical protein
MEFIKGNAIWITPIIEAIFQEYSADIYENISTEKMYTEKIDLDCSSLHSLHKTYIPETRYDALFTNIITLS